MDLLRPLRRKKEGWDLTDAVSREERDGKDMREHDTLRAPVEARYHGNPQRSDTDPPAYTNNRLVHLLSSLTIVMGLVTVTVASLFGSVFPLVRHVPYIVESKERQYVRVQQISSNVDYDTLERESFIRKYILAREEINLVDDGLRWQWVSRVSSMAVFQQFRKLGLDEKTSVWQDAVANQYTREIELNAVWHAPNDLNVWYSELLIRKTRFGENIADPMSAIVTARLGNLPPENEVARSDALENPLRLAVISYSISDKKAAQETAQ